MAPEGSIWTLYDVSSTVCPAPFRERGMDTRIYEVINFNLFVATFIYLPV